MALYDDESNITAYLDAGDGFMVRSDDVIATTGVDPDTLDSYRDHGTGGGEWAMAIPTEDVESVRITADEVEFGLAAGGTVTVRAYYI